MAKKQDGKRQAVNGQVKTDDHWKKKETGEGARLAKKHRHQHKVGEISGQATDELIYHVAPEDEDRKMIDIMTTRMGLSSRLIRRSKMSGQIHLNGQSGAVVSTRCKAGDVIKLIMDVAENHFEPEDMPIEVLYEDGDLLVINKQPFVVVHPTKGHPTGTIANGVAYYLQSKDVTTKIRFINRLDRDTSGILLIGKNQFAQQSISNQMRENTVGKSYFAVVAGHMAEPSGTINLPIGRPTPEDVQRAVMADGQESVTHYRVIEQLQGYDLLEVELETGRTHQIRVHLSHLGHPLVGDHLYGGNMEIFNRQALHCHGMSFNLPRTKEPIELKAEIPEDLKTLIESLR